MFFQITVDAVNFNCYQMGSVFSSLHFERVRFLLQLCVKLVRSALCNASLPVALMVDMSVNVSLTNV